MKNISRKLMSLVAVKKIYLMFALVTVLNVGVLKAQLVLSFTDDGHDVVATLSGSANIAGFTVLPAPAWRMAVHGWVVD